MMKTTQRLPTQCASRWLLAFGMILVLALAPRATLAAPRHDICPDLGGSFAFGVSSFGSFRQWAPDAQSLHGADFRLLYVYILAGGMENPADFEQWYILPFIDTARAMGAAPVLTFYQLLHLGEDAGYSGSEMEIVADTLDDGAVMRQYFEHFIWLLELSHAAGPPVIIQVEPDSWGFMMWAMGVEGNDDPTSIPVQVGGSGHLDVAGFPNHAGGLGQALVALRDQYAPAVRLGWHASNFRVGTRPEVVAQFFSHMGDWDVLFGEHPHLEADESTWWDPWDAAAVDTNLGWADTLTQSAGLPLILWQIPLGTMDSHLLPDPSDQTMLTRFAEAGIAAVLFEHQSFDGETDMDLFRASGELGTPPPAGHAAGGTAAHMRQRVADYSAAPLSWPADTLCASPIATVDAGVPPQSDGGTSPDGSTSPPDDPGNDGCGCTATGAPSGLLFALFMLLGLALRLVRLE
jgi:MYXO-CTERM domain-containing protein